MSVTLESAETVRNSRAGGGVGVFRLINQTYIAKLYAAHLLAGFFGPIMELF